MFFFFNMFLFNSNVFIFIAQPNILAKVKIIWRCLNSVF